MLPSTKVLMPAVGYITYYVSYIKLGGESKIRQSFNVWAYNQSPQFNLCDVLFLPGSGNHTQSSHEKYAFIYTELLNFT